ncbi:hypothetical protein [Marispirochaeta aestuarii]|uniref:hypothetical protein n=1 Tax=Marispirochaeta aestuarii TaxID=1963862 RepID=UPI0029C85B8E|nr:hypothetical protein [Marispirochaeta aestuarii]
MAKASIWSPASHEPEIRQFVKLVGCGLEMEDIHEYPGTNRQPYRTYKMDLTPEQAKFVRDNFAEDCMSRKLDTIIKGTVDGFKVLHDLEEKGERSPTGGIAKAGWKLRSLITKGQV